MSPREFQLLLYCARSLPCTESIRDIVSKGVDWHILLNLAAHHGVRPMLFRTLKSVCWDNVPQKIKLELTLFNKANVQKNLIFTGELLQLLSRFEQNAIPVAALKGPALAASLYGQISLREFSDLDIIVPEADLSKAEDILIARGYQADFANRDYRSAFLGYQGQYAFRHSKTGISVDLHWRLSSESVPFPVQAAEIWPRLERATLAGRTVPTLGHDDLALFLAAHGTKEGWTSLMWVCDFAELLRQDQYIDWMAVLDRSQRSHSSRPFLLAVALASTLLDAPAPVALVDRALKNSAVRALAENARTRMLRSLPEEKFVRFLNSLKTHDRLRDRLWLVATLLTTRTVGDYRAMPMPKFLWRIYYLTRPFRLAIKTVVLMFRSKKSIR